MSSESTAAQRDHLEFPKPDRVPKHLSNLDDALVRPREGYKCKSLKDAGRDRTQGHPEKHDFTFSRYWRASRPSVDQFSIQKTFLDPRLQKSSSLRVRQTKTMPINHEDYQSILPQHNQSCSVDLVDCGDANIKGCHDRAQLH